MKIAVIDYGVGNLGSVVQGLEDFNVIPFVVERPSDMLHADAAILPGVGNFGDCASLLREGGWYDAINDFATGRVKPLLGICLGMQLLATTSSEGMRGEDVAYGLDLIPGNVKHLGVLGCLERIPHVGWNDVQLTPSADNSRMFVGVDSGTDFYFVHSFAFVPDDTDAVIANAKHGVDFAAAVQKGNVWGTQFHPEKSSKAGLRVLKNFVESV